MKKFLFATLSAVLLLTLALSFTSCETGPGGKETTSLISTSESPVTTEAPVTTEPPVTTHEHSYSQTVTAPTCTEKGFTTYTCSCGDTYKDNFTDALGHSFGEWVTTKAATCTATGTETRTCTRCGATETRDIPISAHQYKDVVTPPTKNDKGYTTHTCLVCGTSYVDTYTDPTGSTGLAYSVNSDGSVTITGYGSCTDENVYIYSTYYVLDSAGNKVSKLVTGIAAGAFMNNDTIKTFYIPASVTTIGDGAFAGCTKLTAFTVESDNKNFSTTGGVLMSKDGSTVVAYPAGLTLTTYTVSASVTAIRPSAFAGCANLLKFEVVYGNTKFAVVDDVLYNYEKETLVAYPGGKSLALLLVPSSVKTIGDYAFFNAKKLSGVTFYDRTYEADGTTIKVHGVSSIGAYAFYGCSELTSVEIPNITDTLGQYAFAFCAKLTNISFGKELKEISAHCFESCTGLVNVVIKPGVKTVGEYAFYNCTGMTSLVIGKDVATIGLRAFTGCLNKGKDANGKNIAKVYYEGTSEKWGGSTISVDATNTMYLTIYADIYFYSETSPGTGNHWHYDANGVPVAY